MIKKEYILADIFRHEDPEDFLEKDEVQVLCPYSHNGSLEENASASYNTTNDLYKCFTCDKGANYGQLLFDKANLLTDHSKSKPLMHVLTKANANFLNYDIAYEYLHNNALLLLELMARYGFSAEVLEQLKVGATSNLTLSVPVFIAGALADTRKYAPDNKVKWKGEQGSKVGVILPFDIWNAAGKDEVTYICEGEKDMLAVRSVGLNAISITGGALQVPHLFARHFAGRDVCILYDNDEAGIKGATKLSIELEKWGATVKNVRAHHEDLDYKGDMWDYINKLKKTKEDILEICENTKSIKEASELATVEEKAITEAERSELEEEANYIRRMRSGATNLIADEDLETLGYFTKTGTWKWTVSRVSKYIWERLDIIEFDGARYFNATYDRRELRLYEPLADSAEVRAFMLSHIASSFTYNERVEVTRHLIDSKVKKVTSLKNELYFMDGSFETWYVGNRKLELVEEVPADVYITAKLKSTVNVEAKGDSWKGFIASVTLGDTEMTKQLQELAGSCLVPGLNVQKAFILVGKGLDGKSTFMDAIINMLGNENVSKLFLDVIEKNSHELVKLPGKRLNYADEIKGDQLMGTAVVKTVIGPTTLFINPKHKNPYEAKFDGRLVCSTNTLPRTADSSKGWIRRWIILHFKNSLTDAQADYMLPSKLEKEADFILLWAIQGLVRLLKQGQLFTETTASKDSLTDYALDNDATKMFVMDYPLTWFHDKTTLIVYRKYVAWCEDEGKKPMAKRNFEHKIMNNHDVDAIHNRLKIPSLQPNEPEQAIWTYTKGGE